MATSRPIRRGEWLTDIRSGSPFLGANDRASGLENPDGYVLQSDFELEHLEGDEYWHTMCERVFGISADNPISMETALTNGTAPGLYVREGDDTSDWETYRQVLARRVEEAMAARRGGESGVDETATRPSSPPIHECPCCYNSRRITHSQDDDGRICPYCFDWREVAQAREDAAALAAARAMPTATTRRDDEIRVGDVVEVVSCSDAFTAIDDVGGGGRVVSIEHENAPTRAVYLSPCDGLRVPRAGFVSLVDVRKVSSPPQTVAVTVSPMSDGEAARIEAAVTDEARRSVSSPLASSSDETTTRRVVNPVPPAVSVSLRPRDFNSATITDYLQSLGATHIHVRQAPGSLPVVEAAGLSQQAFDAAWQRELDRLYGRIDAPSSSPPSSPPPPTIPPPSPSRFSLLEVDLPPEPTSSTRRSLDADLAALQDELRAERERNRAPAAAQAQKSRFELLECDLPAPARGPTPRHDTASKTRPVVSSSSPPRRPVETITDLTTARSPLELARMLEGLNDELSTMMRQREAN